MVERNRREFLALIGFGAAAAAFGRPSNQRAPLEVTYYYLPG